ncbi:MAG: hypothetical protein O7A06_06430 [Acidobacteria bacterium]|nr:hypothetical protein [Acidobacteriota bacterium]
MNQKTFSRTASVIFSLVALLHGLRLVFGWEAIIAGWMAPPWASGVAVLMAGYLSYEGLRLSRKSR